MNFIIIYNKSNGWTDEIIPIADDPKEVIDLWHRVRDRYADNKNIQVNLVSANNVNDVKKYFLRFNITDKNIDDFKDKYGHG